MPTLTTLPRELRDAIIDLVLWNPLMPATASPISHQERCERQICPIERPSYIEEEEQNRQGQVAHVIYNAKPENIFAFRNPSAYRPHALDLLLVSRQMHEEVKRRMDRTPPTCALLVNIVEESEFWPTWLDIPLGAPKNFDVAAFSFAATSPPTDGIGDFGGNGSAWTAFIDIIMRFLRIGPTSPFDKKEVDGHITVKDLIINCISPRDLPANIEVAPEGLPIYRDMWTQYTKMGDQHWSLKNQSKPLLKPGKSYVMRPEALADFIHSNFRTLLFGAGPYSTMLYERVGEVRIHVNGDAYHTLNLEGCLTVRCGFLDGSPDLPGSGFDWYRQVLERRKARNFPVYDSETKSDLPAASN